MLRWERELTETNPGRLNLESWAGSRTGQRSIDNVLNELFRAMED